MTHDSHDHDIQDLVAAYVLGAVTPDEAAMVAEHLATCASCRSLEHDLRAVEALLPELVEELAPPPALKARVMAAVQSEPRGTAGDAQSVPPAAAPERAAPPTAVEPLPMRPRRLPAPYPLLALAAMLVLAVICVGVWRLFFQQPAPTRTLAVQGQAMRSINGRLYYYQDGNRIELDLSGLRQIPSSRVYELWLVRLHGATPVLARGIGEFRPDAGGHARLSLRGYDVPAYNLVGFTVERAPGATMPTFPLVAKAAIS